MKPSAYNFVVPHNDGSILFNARTGKLLRLTQPISSPLAAGLVGEDDAAPINVDQRSYDLLVREQFVMEDDFDEIGAIRTVFWTARNDAPAVVTITTTLDCNLGCFYCYEERSNAQLEHKEIPAILDHTEALLRKSKRSKLHVDWYGGEPTLNLLFLEKTSEALQDLCVRLGVQYSASIISNGTQWPEDVAGFISRHRIRQVQITFDGMPETHNKRRFFRSRADTGRSSFAEASELVSKLVHVCRVDVRFNMDELNKREFIPFTQFASNSGWFATAYHATLQPARVSPYTERSRFVTKVGIGNEEFQSLRSFAESNLPLGSIEEPESVGGQARPKTSVCAALSNNAVVIGADQKLYRCGLQVSETNRSIGFLQSTPFKVLNNAPGTDAKWWDEFDPTLLPSCSACSFLPLCLGGCPKKQLERDQAALDAQSVYWRENLARLIYKTAGVPGEKIVFGEQQQFR
jgi:uncharacterized protein